MKIDIKYFITRGETIKEEKVKSIVHNILPNTLVLENYEPFPGYYSAHIPVDIKPMSVFVILARKYDNIFLDRILKKIRDEGDHQCDGTTAVIDAGRSRYYAIRIKNLDCFTGLIKIQKKFIENGIELHASRNIDRNVLFSVQKTFLLEKLENSVYKNLREESKYYFPLERYLTWKEFKEITLNVKNNISNNLFDAALCYFYTTEGLTDMVRIFDRKDTHERILEIKEHYAKALKRM